MTGPRFWRDGTRFYKRVRDPGEVDRLIDRARQIGLAGGRSPAPEYCADKQALAFPLLDGTTGVSLIDGGTLSDLLVPLQAVSRAVLTDLPPYDPFAKIPARLGPEPPRWLTDRLARLADMAANPPGVVHGDFHCGQLIRDRAGRVWVVDLDDMAFGPVEADLGNFAAHLATRPETRRADLRDGVRHWGGQVLEAWNRLSAPCEPALFWRHLDIALVRRALKLRDDRGDARILEALETLPLSS